MRSCTIYPAHRFVAHLSRHAYTAVEEVALVGRSSGASSLGVLSGSLGGGVYTGGGVCSGGLDESTGEVVVV